MSEPETAIPVCTTQMLPQGLPQGCVINRCTVLASRGHDTPGEARNHLAEWAMKCNYDAVVGVQLLPVVEVPLPGEHTTEVHWAAYGTAIGW